MHPRTVAGLLILTSLIWAVAAQDRNADGDYLTPSLRARVERLKAEAPVRTTDAAVLRERLETLWEWANAYSLTGGPIPGDFPQTTANANRTLRGLAPGGPQLAIGRISAFIARFAREFQIKDELPGAFGELTLAPSGPFQAGEYVTIEQTYTVGELPMAVGGGIVLGRRRSSDWQVRDPAGAGYVSIRTSNPEARFAVSEPWGNWVSFQTRQSAAFRLSGANLERGDTVTITFGDRSGGGPGLQLQNWSNDRVVFTTLLDLEGNGWALTPAWPSFEVVGKPETRFLNAVAPSVVAPGEPFVLAIRAEDRFKNVSSGDSPQLEVLLNGEPFRSLPAGGPALRELADLRIDSPGVYRFEVRTGDGSVRGASNPVLVQATPAHRIYWGETHGHTGFAEGQGSPDGYYRFGRDVARLDFLSLSEHDIWMDDFEWKALQEMVEKYQAPGRFTTILGFEWTSRLAYGGHHNVFFRDVPGRLRVPNQKAPLLDELYAGLRRDNSVEDVLVIPHAHQPGDWTNSDTDMERLVEIQSGHGTFDWIGDRYLANGFRVGFIGASDNHVGHPGYSGMTNRQLGGLAAALAAENTSAAIFDALRNRATYATTGERIILDATLNGVRMGSAQADAAERTIECRVHGTAPIDAIDVIKNGRLAYSQSYLGTELAADAWVQVGFESSTEVIGRRQVPRGDRPWRGAIRVEGADLTGFREPWFQNPQTYQARLDGGELRFRLHTRGRGTALLLRLRGATADTRVIVAMDETVERPGSGGYERTPQRLPAAEAVFRLGDLGRGADRREFRVLEHVDALSAQLVRADGALDQRFRYTDLDEPRPGDYYYVRVRQVDGAVAWSSPFWVDSGPRDE